MYWSSLVKNYSLLDKPWLPLFVQRVSVFFLSYYEKVTRGVILITLELGTKVLSLRSESTRLQVSPQFLMYQ